MVRIVAITARDIVPGRRDRRAHEVGGESKFERKQDPCGKFEPDLPADHLVGGAANRGRQQAQQCLERTVAHDENGRRFDGESDKSRDLLELLFEPYGRFPFKPSSAWR
jgi:hypothetical protein